MFHRQQTTRTGSRYPAIGIACLLVAAYGAFTSGPTTIRAQQPPGPAVVPKGAQPLLIAVSQVSGDVTYTRRVNNRTRVRTVTLASKLQAGDTVHMDVGARCLLLFRNAGKAAANLAPAFDAIRPIAFRPEAPATDGDGVVAAVLLRGYSEASIAMAFERNQAATIQIDMPQGVARAGVVPTAIKPRFRIRSPRTVVAVRGTEIRELEISVDRGDILSMGRTGVVAANVRSGLYRSAQSEQGTRKGTGTDRRSSRLVRAIMDLNIRSRVVLAGPHKGRIEFDQAKREPRDAQSFGKGDRLKPNGNPKFQNFINSNKPDDGTGRADSTGGGGGGGGDGTIDGDGG